MTSQIQAMLRAFAVASILACYCTISHGQEEKIKLVQRIVAAQGLTDILDQMLVQQKNLARQQADRTLEEVTRQGKAVVNEKARAAFTRLKQRSADIFASEEIVQAWASEYAKELSIQELTAILQYYESSIGRKDVAASKTALWRFTAWCAQQWQERMTPIIADFMAELEAARR